MHDVGFVSPSEVLAAVQTLRRLRDEGKTGFVGTSGFPVHVLCSLAEMILAETGEPLDAILSYGHFTIQNPTLGLAEVAAGPGHTDDQSPLRRFREAGALCKSSSTPACSAWACSPTTASPPARSSQEARPASSQNGTRLPTSCAAPVKVSPSLPTKLVRGRRRSLFIGRRRSTLALAPWLFSASDCLPSGICA